MVTQPKPRLKVYTFWLFLSVIASSLPESDMFPIQHGLSQPGLSRSPLTLRGELDYLNTTYSQDLKGKVQAQVPISYSLRTVSVTTHMMSSQPLQAVCP